MMRFRIFAEGNSDYMEAQGELFTIRPVLKFLGFDPYRIQALFDESDVPAQIGPSIHGFVVVKVRN